MQYFFAADVAKENFVVLGCDETERSVMERMTLDNNTMGFAALVESLRAFCERGATGHFLVEASGNLHENLVTYLAKHLPSVRLYIINPLVGKRYGTAKLRRNHTDPDDAAHLVEFLRNEWKELHRWRSDETLRQLRRLTLERDRLVKDRTREINRLDSQLQVCFPEFRHVFKDLGERLPLAILQASPTAAHLARRRLDALARFRAQGRGNRPLGRDRAAQLIGLAKRSAASATSDMDADIVRDTTERLATLNRQIARLEKQIETLLSEIETARPDDEDLRPGGDEATDGRRNVLAHQAELMRPIPGVGPVVVAAICARAGDIRQYKDGNALSAQLGTCPARHQSGRSRDSARLTPYGHRKTRASLYMGMHSAVNSFLPLKFHYQRLRDPNRRDANGRPNTLTHKQAIVACMNRVVHWIYAVVTSDSPFDPQRVWENCRRHFGHQWEEFLERQTQNQQGDPPQ